jgi:hypothetical protein
MTRDSRDRSAHRWVPTGEPDMVELRDLISGRSVQLVRPDVDDLPGVLLTDMETLVFRWADFTTAAEAEDTVAGREPVPALRAMSWVFALWAVVCETRFGKPADAIIRDLDYRGGRRRDRTPERARTWRALTQRVRLGALAALTEDPRAVAAYRQVCTEPEDVGPLLIRHTLIHLDALAQDMRRHDLPPQGLVAEFVAHTSPADGPRRRLCFRPPQPG